MSDSSLIDTFKALVTKCVNGSITRTELNNGAKKLNVVLIPQDDFSKQKRILLRQLLIHILREEISEREEYERLLKETNLWLNQPKINGYPCVKTGCTFHGVQHRDYIQHLSQQHFLDATFTCNFKRECGERFSSIDELTNHVKNQHQNVGVAQAASLLVTSSRSPVISQPCKCAVNEFCSQMFPTVKKLLQHINNAHHLETKVCCFQGCEKIMGPQFSTRHHFYEHHTKKHRMELKEEFLVETSNNISGLEDQHFEAEGGADNEDVDVEMVNEEENLRAEGEGTGHIEDEMNRIDDIMKMFSIFFSELCYMKMIAQTTIQFIVENFLKMTTKSRDFQKERVKRVLVEAEVPSNVIGQVMAVLEDDVSIKAQENLNSEYKRNKFLEENFKIVKPQEIILNPSGMVRGEKKESYMYVPVKESFKALLEDSSFNKMMETVRNNPGHEDDTVLEDIKDGWSYKNTEYFQQNPDAFCGILYSDGIEIVNPLGAARGRHKLLQLYWTLADIPKMYRGRIDRIQLGIVIREKVLKKYGYQAVYRRMIEDMCDLEKNGVKVLSPVPRTVKIAFFMHIGDSLEQHSLGGFQCCFSSGKMCRLCKIDYKDIEEKIYELPEPRTVEGYDAIVDQIDPLPQQAEDITIDNLHDHLFDQTEEPRDEHEDIEEIEEIEEESDSEREDNTDDEGDGSSSSSSGIKARCPLNVLSTFHSVKSLPMDVMHDLLEGIIPQDLLACLKILIKLKYFNQSQYNQAMLKVNFKGHEKPEPLDTKLVKLKGKALSHLSHIRNVGLIMKHLRVKEDMFQEPSYNLIHQLILVTEKLMSPKIRIYEVLELEDQITSYLELRSSIKNEHSSILKSMKPKHHFALHYPDQIMKMGPPVGVWTARYESKNRIPKMYCHAAKNFKNPAYTVAMRQQFRASVVFYKGMFKEKIELPLITKRKIDLIIGKQSPLISTVIEKMSSEDLVTDSVEVNGQRYKVEDVVVLKIHNSDFIEVGIVLQILIKKGEVFFIVNRYRAIRDEVFNFFETLNYDEESFHTVNVDDLEDAKPLVKNGVYEKFRFTLHHHLSVSTKQ